MIETVCACCEVRTVGEGTVCIGGADSVRPEAEDIVEHREWGVNDCHCRVVISIVNRHAFTNWIICKSVATIRKKDSMIENVCTFVFSGKYSRI